MPDAELTTDEVIRIAERRLQNAHRARRAREHLLDDIRRALCDIGFMDDDDPFGHADLADVIRQNMPNDEPEPAQKDTPACARCHSRGYVPDFANGLDPVYGEPGKKPCPDCQPPKPELTTPGGYFRCLSQYRSRVDGWVQCQLEPQHTTRHDYQNGVVACSWADGDQA